MQFIKSIFKRREKPHKPLIVERLAAHGKFTRYFGILCLLLLSASIVFYEVQNGFIGAKIIQTDNMAELLRNMQTVIPIAIMVFFGVFLGVIAGSRGFLSPAIKVVMMLFALYQFVHMSKNQIAIIEVQNAQKQNGDNGAASLEARIKLASERAAKWDAAAAAVKIPSDWQQRAMQRSKDNAMLQAEKNREEASKLLDEKAKLPPAKPTEAGIVGDSVARAMAVSISALLIISQSILNILIGLIISSFSIHRKIEYVAKNQETHALQPIDLPKPAREPMPKMPELGGVPTDTAAAVVLSAGLLGSGGSAAVAAQTPTVVASSAPVVPASSAPVVDFEGLLQAPVELAEQHPVAVDTPVAPAPNKRTMDDLRAAIKSGECGTTITEIRRFMDVTHNPALEIRKKLWEDGVVKHYSYNEAKELIKLGK